MSFETHIFSNKASELPLHLSKLILNGYIYIYIYILAQQD